MYAQANPVTCGIPFNGELKVLKRNYYKKTLLLEDNQWYKEEELIIKKERKKKDIKIIEVLGHKINVDNISKQLDITYLENQIKALDSECESWMKSCKEKEEKINKLKEESRTLMFISAIIGITIGIIFTSFIFLINKLG